MAKAAGTTGKASGAKGGGKAGSAKAAAAFGLWPSTIAAADLARATRRFGLIQGDGPWVYWTEGRPEEKGRQALMRARPAAGRGEPVIEELLAAPWSARSRVHEYGGGEFLAAGERVFFVNDADQDVYELTLGGAPRRLTSEATMRFADLALDAARDRLVAVGERHPEGAGEHARPDNLVVAIALSGPERGKAQALLQGRDFYAFPRLAPDGTRLAVLAWDLPDMPWDQAELLVAPVRASGEVGRPRRVAGGDGVAAMQPIWLADGRLAFLHDASGYGNIAVLEGEAVRDLTRLDADLGAPLWGLGTRTLVARADGALVAHGQIDGRPAIVTMSEHEKRRPSVAIDEAGSGVAGLGALAAFDGGIAATLARDKAPGGLGLPAAGRRSAVLLRASSSLGLDPAGIAAGEEIQFRGGDGKRSYARFYAPRSSTHRGPRDARPPLLVLAHGGPTASAGRGLSPRIQFYTSRGFAVVDVDYAGSTGYGRRYRERLDGQWGIADVADCAAAVRFLAKNGAIDAARVAIAGGSAGGYTVLMALATTEGVFAAGASHYGISDLALLMEHTHKFEAGYLHRLLGTTARSWKKVCAERSPLTLIDRMTRPLVLFQGLDDKVVPPEQSRLIAEKLRSRGVAVELHEFAGEGHGFRRADTIVAVAEAELAFLTKALALGSPAQ